MLAAGGGIAAGIGGLNLIGIGGGRGQPGQGDGVIGGEGCIIRFFKGIPTGAEVIDLAVTSLVGGPGDGHRIGTKAGDLRSG